MWSYGMRNKSETTSYVQTFHAATNAGGRTLFIRTDEGGDVTNRSFVELCDTAGTWRELTAPRKPQQNVIVKFVIWRSVTGGHTTCRETRLISPNVVLTRIPHVADGNRLWLVTVCGVADVVNRSVTKAGAGWTSPDEVSYSRLPDMRVGLVVQEDVMRVNRSTYSDVQSVPRYFLNNVHNHPSSTVEVIIASTGRIFYISDMVWTVHCAPAFSLPAPMDVGVSGRDARPTISVLIIR